MPGYAKSILDALSGTDALDVDLRTGGAAVGPTNPLAVGKAYTSSATIVRPNDTTAYTAGDVVGGATEFSNIGPAGGQIQISGARLRIDVGAVPGGMANMRLHLYSATPPSALTDNAALDLPAGDRNLYLGFIDLGAPQDFGSTLWAQVSAVCFDAKLTTSSLFAYLQTSGAYTPTAQASKTVTLHSLAVG